MNAKRNFQRSGSCNDFHNWHDRRDKSQIRGGRMVREALPEAGCGHKEIETWEAIYVQWNNEARSRNRCCRGKQKVLHICVWVCVYVHGRGRMCTCARIALLIQYAKRRRHTVCGFSGSAIIFPRYLITDTSLRKKFTEHKTCVLIFSTDFIWNISHSTKNSARYCHRCENVFT